MSYYDEQRKRAEAIREEMFSDPGQGVFRGKPREFVLSEPALNLWAGIRDDAKEYFAARSIPWWKGAKDDPTGHMLSSQVACVNHLYFIRQRPDIATPLLKALYPAIDRALPIGSGFVSFEYVGPSQVLPEKSFTRGANCTSVDAAMMGENNEGKKILFLIEWKYTESYSGENLYCQERAKVYDSFIQAPDSPFAQKEVQVYYYEPFYQMMRQTLLGHLLVGAHPEQFDDYYHVHVIPRENTKLRTSITSPSLQGDTISDVWRALLREADRYVTISPEELIKPAQKCEDTHSAVGYLRRRYW